MRAALPRYLSSMDIQATIVLVSSGFRSVSPTKVLGNDIPGNLRTGPYLTDSLTYQDLTGEKTSPSQKQVDVPWPQWYKLYHDKS